MLVLVPDEGCDNYVYKLCCDYKHASMIDAETIIGMVRKTGHVVTHCDHTRIGEHSSTEATDHMVTTNQILTRPLTTWYLCQSEFYV